MHVKGVDCTVRADTLVNGRRRHVVQTSHNGEKGGEEEKVKSVTALLIRDIQCAVSSKALFFTLFQIPYQIRVSMMFSEFC